MLVKTVEHNLDDSGLVTRLELERTGGDATASEALEDEPDSVPEQE